MRPWSAPVRRVGTLLLVVALSVTLPASIATSMPASLGVQAAAAHPLAAHARTGAACTKQTCTFKLFVNSAACPKFPSATGTIKIQNRFATDSQTDLMTVSASGLPPNTDFDLFTVQNFTAPFGFAWYQADLESNSEGKASVQARGIFDVETFILNPASPTSPVHTYNVGFWFSSPAQEAAKCQISPPSPTPFNGEQNAGLLAMITHNGPLQSVQS